MSDRRSRRCSQRPSSEGATTTLSDVAMAAAGAAGMVDGSAIDAAGLSSSGSSLGKGRGKAKANSFALTWKGGLALESAAADAAAVTFAVTTAAAASTVARGFIENKHSTDVESMNPVSTSV